MKTLSRNIRVFIAPAILWLCLPEARSEMSRGLLTGAECYELLEGELERCLAREDRFTLLPNNIAHISVTPEHAPVFTVSRENRSRDRQTPSAPGEGDAKGFQLRLSGKLRRNSTVLPPLPAGLEKELGEGRNFSCSSATDSRGRTVIHVREQGLAVIEKDSLAWLDRSAMMRSMREIIGFDSKDRAYFVGGYSKGFRSEFWLYTPEGNAVERPSLPAIPASPEAVADSLGRIWFFCNAAKEDDEERRKVLAKAKTVGIDRSEKDKKREALYASRGWKPPALYCYDNGELFKYFSDPGFQRACLVPGANGAIFVLSQDFRYPHYLIAEGAVTSLRDFHELAREEFDLLLRTAPSLPYRPEVGGKLPNSHAWGTFQICRTGELLWLNYGNIIEAYREGEPMLINERLTLREDGKTHLTICGVFPGNPSKVVLSSAQARSFRGVLWAIPGEEGIALRRSALKVQWPGKPNSWGQESFRGRPLSADGCGKLYLHRREGINGVWLCSGPDEFQPMQDCGEPVLVTASGKLLAKPKPLPYKGYRVASDGVVRDIATTYTESMAILGELANGDLIAATPQGLAWLRCEDNGDWKIQKEILISPEHSIERFLGTTRQGLAFLSRRLSGDWEIVWYPVSS